MNRYHKISGQVTKHFQLADRPTRMDLEKAGLPKNSPEQLVNWVSPFRPGVIGLVAVRTGETRAPRAEEWYLSGAEPEAYRAPNDLASEYQILKLVTIKTTIVSTTVEL